LLGSGQQNLAESTVLPRWVGRQRAEIPHVIVERLDPDISQQGAALGLLPFQERSLRLRQHDGRLPARPFQRTGKVGAMKLKHVNLTSIDVPGDRAMFETYFGLHCSTMRGKSLAVMHDEQGMIFVLNDLAKKRGDFTIQKTPMCIISASYRTVRAWVTQ
jgi:hypothetical protein